MRVLISPAKKMKEDTDSLAFAGEPVFLERTENILAQMRKLSFEEAKELWGCNEKLARQNYERIQKMELHRRLTPAVLSYEGIQYQYMAPAVFETQMLEWVQEHLRILSRIQKMELHRRLTPAVLSYEGIQYQYMAPAVFETQMLEWVQEHLRILSGFYGILRPMDGVTPYRLEMQAKLSCDGFRDLYEFWGNSLYEAVKGHTILNLASKEYSRCVERFLEPEDRFITCVFGERNGSKIVQKGTYAKMARGEMVRFLAEHKAEKPEEAKKFEGLGFHFDEKASDEKNYVFVREEKSLCKNRQAL